MKIPPHVIVMDAIGALATALGLWGALAGGGATLPFLATPRVAWSLVAIGVVLMVYSGVTLVRIVRERSRERGPGEQ
jgi:hypothetical protein